MSVDILEKHISRHLGYMSPEERKKLEPFLWSLRNMYLAGQNERHLMEESLKISSEELSTKNQEIKQQYQKDQIAIENLLSIIYKWKKFDTCSLAKIDTLSYEVKDIIKKWRSDKRVIAEKEKYLRDILNSMREWVCVIDSKLQIKMINAQALSMLWKSLCEVSGKPHNEVLHFRYQKNPEKFYPLDIHALKDKDAKKFICDLTLDGKKWNIPVNLILSKTQNTASDTIIVLRDISEEKQLDIMKEEFISIASHELRTPMTVINGYLAIILQESLGKLSPKQKQYLERMQVNIDHLLEMIHDMLDIGRLESKKVELEHSCFSIRETLNQVNEWLAHKFQWKHICLSIRGNIKKIYGDEKRIRQIIINLVNNAFKFTENKGKIEIFYNYDEEKSVFHFSVTDSGIGIKQEDKKKLFQKFSQVQSHLQRKEEGTGLWLVISKLLVQEMGGVIGVKSTYGKWSEFYFSIPMKLQQ